MAERRMFAKTIIDSDAFLDMPASAQCLYFHLSMRADDDGFINNPKKIQRAVGAADDDLKLLIAKNFILPFESGVVVIKHWKIHNLIRKDRYKETVYLEEKAQLETKVNGAYTLGVSSGCQVVNQMATQYRIGQDRIGEVRTDKESLESGGGVDRIFVANLFEKYTASPINAYHINTIIEMVAALHQAAGDELKVQPLTEDDKGLLEIAFKLAADANKFTLAYIQGIFKNFWQRNIKTVDAYWAFESRKKKPKKESFASETNYDLILSK